MEVEDKFVTIIFFYPSKNPMRGHGYKAKNMFNGDQCLHIHRTEASAQKCADSANKKTRPYSDYQAQRNYATGEQE